MEETNSSIDVKIIKQRTHNDGCVYSLCQKPNTEQFYLHEQTLQGSCAQEYSKEEWEALMEELDGELA